MCPQPPTFAGQVEHRHDDHQVDQGVLDERDQRGRPQPRDEGEDGQDQERDEQRQVLDERVARGGADAHHGEHGLDAHQLQRDVGHQREDAGEGDGQRQAARPVAAADEVSRRDVVVRPRDRPQPGQEDERDREHDDRVGHREEAGHRAGPEHRRGHRDKGVRGIEVTAEQEPAHERTEPAAPKPPLVQVHHVLGPAPPRRREADQRDQEEQDDDDGEGDGVDVAHLATSPGPPAPGRPAPGPSAPGLPASAGARSRFCKNRTIPSTMPTTGM